MIRNFLFCMLLLILTSCGKVPPYDEELGYQQAKVAMDFQRFKHSIDEQAFSGVHTGKACKPAVVFIHGAPGDWKAWGRYLGDQELLDKAFMISIDRPGYAGSGLGTPHTNMRKQSEIIMKGIRKEHKGPFILVGHSYGGPLQFQMAADYPDEVAAMIVLAGAVDPKLHYKRFYHRLGDVFFIRPFLPTPLKVTNKEMLALKTELLKLQPDIHKIKAATTVIQGEDDWLVPVGNADYAKERLTSVRNIEIIKLKDQGHFLPWEQYDLIKQQVLKHAQDLPGCGEAEL